MCFAIPAMIALAASACQSRTATTAVTALSLQADLVMNKDAPVTLLGSEAGKEVRVGRVVSTEVSGGKTAVHLAIDSSQLHLIPANVLTKITPPTAVQLIIPPNPAPERLKAGQVLDAQVTR
jgi:phospholipid/cholesterol/gamma-HCH transport system substrate-binding protein